MPIPAAVLVALLAGRYLQEVHGIAVQVLPSGTPRCTPLHNLSKHSGHLSTNSGMPLSPSTDSSKTIHHHYYEFPLYYTHM